MQGFLLEMVTACRRKSILVWHGVSTQAGDLLVRSLSQQEKAMLTVSYTHSMLAVVLEGEMLTQP